MKDISEQALSTQLHPHHSYILIDDIAARYCCFILLSRCTIKIVCDHAHLQELELGMTFRFVAGCCMSVRVLELEPGH